MRRTPARSKKKWAKHSIGTKASLKSLKRYCMEIWSELVKTRDDRRCVLCGGTKYVQSHHLITRMYAPTRYDLNNGLSLCAKCHELGLISASHAPWIVYEWLENNRPEQYAWFLQARKGIVSPPSMKLTIQDYRLILKSLLNIFEQLFPQTIKSCKYNPFTDEEEIMICSDYTDKILSRRDLALKYGVTEIVITGVLRRRKIKMRKSGSNRQEIRLLKKEFMSEEARDV